MTDQPWEPPEGVDASYALFAKEARVRVDDGTSIAYTFRNPTGRSIPLLFANGWSCSDAYWGKLVTDLEARGHPCLVPDTRGHGASGLPRSPGRGAKNLSLSDVSIPRVARDLVAVLDDAGVERAVVIGHSMGTQTALEVYRQIPDRVAGLALLAGTFENPTKTFYGSGIGDRLFPIGAALMRVLPEVLDPIWWTIGPANVGHFGARLAKAAGPGCSAEDLHPYLLHLKSTDPAVMVLSAAAMRAHSAADLLAKVEAPTLVIAAGSDVFTPSRCSEAMHHRILRSELVTFPLAGHTLPVEEPDAIAEHLDDFITRRVTTTPPRVARKPTARKAASKKSPVKKPPVKKPPVKKPPVEKAVAKTAPAKKAAGARSGRTTG